MPHSAHERFMGSALDDLEQLRKGVADLQGRMHEVQDAAPEQTEGSDATGAVRVTLDPNGIPESIEVKTRWQEQIRPQDLAAAVTDASRQATQRRGEAWARIYQRSTESGQTSLEFRNSYLDQERDPGVLPGLAAPRSVDELAGEAIRTLDGALSSSGVITSAQGQGTSTRKDVTIRLGRSGALFCIMDARWAANQSGGALSQALGTALAAARQDRAPQKPAGGLDHDRAARLLAELNAAMSDMPRSRAQ